MHQSTETLAIGFEIQVCACVHALAGSKQHLCKSHFLAEPGQCVTNLHNICPVRGEITKCCRNKKLEVALKCSVGVGSEG